MYKKLDFKTDIIYSLLLCAQAGNTMLWLRNITIYERSVAQHGFAL